MRLPARTFVAAYRGTGRFIVDFALKANDMVGRSGNSKNSAPKPCTSLTIELREDIVDVAHGLCDLPYQSSLVDDFRITAKPPGPRLSTRFHLVFRLV